MTKPDAVYISYIAVLGQPRAAISFSEEGGNLKRHARNGYKIIEETLNLRDVRIFDYVEDEHGNRIPVLNKKETAIAQGKQELIKQAFADWIWKDPDRRERLCKLYNEKFNSIRPREYDGSHLNFVGMNPEITLRPHQVNAIAHILYGGNTLLAHVVGAGKTLAESIQLPGEPTCDRCSQVGHRRKIQYFMMQE